MEFDFFLYQWWTFILKKTKVFRFLLHILHHVFEICLQEYTLNVFYFVTNVWVLSTAKLDNGDSIFVPWKTIILEVSVNLREKTSICIFTLFHLQSKLCYTCSKVAYFSSLRKILPFYRVLCLVHFNKNNFPAATRILTFSNWVSGISSNIHLAFTSFISLRRVITISLNRQSIG